MNESNRRIASLNRIDELNQRIAFQNDPLIASWAAKSIPRESKTPSPRPPQDGSKASQDPPQSLAVDQKLASWRHALAISPSRESQKFFKSLLKPSQLIKSWHRGVSSGNIVVVRIPRVSQDPRQGLAVDQKLASWRHTLAISWA